MTDDPSLQLFEDSYERLAEHPDDVEYVAGETDAEDHLKALGYHRRRMEEIENHALQEISKIECWQDVELLKIRRKAIYHEKSLESWIARINAKTVNLVNGKVRKITGRLRVELGDVNEVPAEYHTQQVTVGIDKKAVLKAHTDTGECIPGTEVVRGDDTYKITTSGI